MDFHLRSKRIVIIGHFLYNGCCTKKSRIEKWSGMSEKEEYEIWD